MYAVVHIFVFVYFEVGVPEDSPYPVAYVIPQSKNSVHLAAECIPGSLGDITVFAAHWYSFFGQHFSARR